MARRSRTEVEKERARIRNIASIVLDELGHPYSHELGGYTGREYQGRKILIDEQDKGEIKLWITNPNTGSVVFGPRTYHPGLWEKTLENAYITARYAKSQNKPEQDGSGFSI